MRKILSYLIFASFLSFSLFGQDSPMETGKQEDQDMDALRKWIREKRMITLKELGGDLSLSGEVRVEMQGANEKRNGVQQRGPYGLRGIDCQVTKPMFAYDVEFNLMLDYRSDRTWASVKVEFDNDMGQVSGTTNRIALEKAFMGGRLVKGDTFTMDAELGRRNLGNVFDSQIQFSSLFDGALFRFNKASERIGDFYANIAGFLVNDKTNHYAFAGEMGLFRIGNTGFYSKYSFIDWTLVDHKQILLSCLTEDQKERRKLYTKYRNSQVILGYQFMIEQWKKFFRAYVGGLVNHAASGIALTNYKKQNFGAYCGFSIGQVRKKGDWAFNWNYQYVQPQAVPDYDCGGVRRGNTQGIGLYTTRLNGAGVPTTRENAVGSCNFYGYAAELLYAFTNNLTVYQSFVWSHTLDKDLGPNLRFKQYEVEFIYAF